MSVRASGPDFDVTLERFTELGFRVDMIRPADSPTMAVVSKGDIIVEIGSGAAPELARPMVLPELAPLLDPIVTTLDGDSSWVDGRAAMRYRDLIPGRLGGRFIASNIEVCEGGPVPDVVHHHAIRFQMIFCERGWVQVVFEDQGEPFRLLAGDCVLQPPHIRHRVLASSAEARVVEVGCPADHDTLVDHVLELPTGVVDPDRDFGGQRFVHHVAARTPWTPSRFPGIERRLTAIGDATDGLAQVQVLRVDPQIPVSEFSGPGEDAELHFMYVLAGTARFASTELGPGAAVTLVPGRSFSFADLSTDLSLLEVRVG